MEPKLKSENYTNFGGINSKSSPYITGTFEFLNLSNFDFSTPGSLTKRPGSTHYVTTPTSGNVASIYEFSRLSGESYLVATANTNAYTVSGGVFSAFKASLLNNGIFDFVTFVDRLFMGNGQDFFKFDGTNAYSYSLPPGSTATAGLTGTGAGTGFTGIYIYEYGYLNERGYLGPCGPGVTVSVAGHSAVVLSGFTVPAGYGVTALAFYRTDANLTDLFRIGYAGPGATEFVDNNLPLLTDPCNDNLWFTLTPKYLEIFNNQLFMSGFSSALSTVYFSDIGEPEAVQPDFNFEVRTNDGDVITGMKPYQSSMLIFKEKSFHLLQGDSPENFLIRQISDQYGCLSNRAIVTFEDRCLFLDRKGIIEFNGANITVLSQKIEPIFLTMNVIAAKENAVAIHNRLRNEIWFAIPTGSSTVNDTIIVYDYMVNAFTKFEGINVASLSVMKREFFTERAFFGDYSGVIGSYSSSLLADSGRSITCLLKTRFFHDLGNSTEEQFRRLFLDVEPVTGLTSALSINFFSNYGTTSILDRTMYQSPFQSRIDFGIPAKSLAVQVSNSTTTDPVKIHGFTIESRKQRDV